MLSTLYKNELPSTVCKNLVTRNQLILVLEWTAK